MRHTRSIRISDREERVIDTAAALCKTRPSVFMRASSLAAAKEVIVKDAPDGDALKAELQNAVPHSCPEIGYAQAKLRRIFEWAEEGGHIQVEQWARAAYTEIEDVRTINRQLRIAATGKSV